MSTAPFFTAADLRFDEARHLYTLPDGRTVPSVTQILRAVGVSTDFEAIAAMSDEKRAQLEYRRQLGTVVHADCHTFDDNDLDTSTVSADVEPYLWAWADFRANSRLVPLSRERRVFDRQRFYCGTLDGIFLSPAGRHVLVDIKLGDPEDAACAFQTAAYQAAWDLEHPETPIHERWSVQLTPENAVPYRVQPYTDWRDFGKFAAFVTSFHESSARRRTA